MKAKVLLAFGAVAMAAACVAAIVKSNPVEAKADDPWKVAVESTNPTRTITGGGVNSGTNRYWFAANPDTGFWDGSAKMGIWACHSDASLDKAYFFTGYGNNTGTSLDTIYYFDLPTDVTKFVLLRLNPTEENSKHTVWNQSDDMTASNVSKTALNYLYFDNSKIKVSSSAYTGAGAHTLKEVLMEFPTCSTSKADVQSLYTNFWAQKWDNNNGKVSEVTLTEDYDYAAYVLAGKSYSGLTPTSAIDLPTVEEKWNALCANAGVNPNTGVALAGKVLTPIQSETAVAPALTAGIAAIGVAAAGTMLFVAKKRKEN